MTAGLRIAAADLNGLARGKRLPDSYLEQLDDPGVRMPLSALNLDIQGADIEGSPLVFETGDADGVLKPTGRGPVPMPWLRSGATLVPMWMFTDDGAAFDGDPRHALKAVLARYADRGWRVVAATELEFYLVDDAGLAPIPPGRNHPLEGDGILSLARLDAYDAFLTGLYAGAQAMGLSPQAAISESGVSQFEINLAHADAMRMADDTWLMKMLIKGLARKHAMTATFLPKPMPDEAGSGMHVHFSVVDGDGRNVFDDGSDAGSALLQQAVAGCLAAMPELSLIFAPHLPSYDRFVPGAHAPTSAAWGYENRTVAIRIPGGPPAARRIEHRVAGGDTNPYLLMAAILGSALVGIEDGTTPPPPVAGDAYGLTGLPTLVPDLSRAVDALAAGPIAARIFPPLLIDNLIRTKRQEHARLAPLPGRDLMRICVGVV